ncbi:MAG: chain-length determining protein [Bacteroides sp.]|nr:chain-length determining protein [Bacteroides sp.]
MNRFIRQKDNQEEFIDLHELVNRLLNNRKLIFKIICVGAIIGIIIAFSLPKTYKVEVILSPESGQSGGSGGLAGMASMLGVSSINGVSQDALNSSMFPDLIKSTPFILEMYHMKVTTQERRGMILADYVQTQKGPWWGYVFRLPGIAISGVKSMFSQKDEEQGEEKEEVINPFKLTNEQRGNIDAIKNALEVKLDGKSNMSIVTVTFQDPEVAAIVADSAVVKLQEYIINYRTKKAQADCDYLEKLCKQRKDEYLKTQRDYADFMDMNRNVVMQRAQVEGIRLQNDMSIAFQVYSQVETQLQVARAKVQEAKPVFAIVEPATVPLHPAGPNKMLIIVGCLFLAFAGSSAWILFKKQ